jgi:HEXXH motif-containing protein
MDDVHDDFHDSAPGALAMTDASAKSPRVDGRNAGAFVAAAATSAAAFADLTVASDDTKTLRRLIVRDTQRWVSVLRSVPLAHLAPADRALYSAAVGAWSALERQDPRRAHAIVRLPTVSVLLEVIARAADSVASVGDLVRELGALVLFELACQRALPPKGITVEVAVQPWLTLRSLSLRHVVAVDLGVGSALVFGPGWLAAGQGDAQIKVGLADLVRHGSAGPFTAQCAYHPIAPGLMLATDDNNPLSDFEAHPDKEGNQLDLGGHDVAQWTTSLAESVALIDRYLPLLGEELKLLLRLVIPVGFDAERHLSASYQEYIGAVYMTLHPNAMTMVEALIHEFQHNKLNAAFHHDTLLHNAFAPLFGSPVRPDPRPLHGVVLAVHAFQPVALLYAKMAADDHPWAANPAWQRRASAVFATIHEGAMTVLTNAEPTAAGLPFFDEMRRLDDALMATAQSNGWRPAPA